MNGIDSCERPWCTSGAWGVFLKMSKDATLRIPTEREFRGWGLWHWLLSLQRFAVRCRGWRADLWPERSQTSGAEWMDIAGCWWYMSGRGVNDEKKGAEHWALGYALIDWDWGGTGVCDGDCFMLKRYEWNQKTAEQVRPSCSDRRRIVGANSTNSTTTAAALMFSFQQKHYVFTNYCNFQLYGPFSFSRLLLSFCQRNSEIVQFFKACQKRKTLCQQTENDCK